MKNLIRKEMTLVISIAAYLFPLLSALLLIPSYPSVVSFVYFIFSIQITFQFVLRNKDERFSAMLPISRRDIVKSRHITVVLIEALQMLCAVPFVLIATFVVAKNGNPIGMDANFALFGEILIAYAVFNLFFLPTYFKTGYKIGLPFLYGILAFFVALVGMELLIAFVPILQASLDSVLARTVGYQLILLGLGIVVYVAALVLSYKMSVKRYERVTI